MKIAIMGAGGIGAVFGIKLVDGGADVTFIARGAHLRAIRESGLRVEGDEKLYLENAKATDDPAQVGKVDLVIIAVKLWDTDSALKAIQPMVGPHTAILSFQNGVMKDEAIAKAYGQAHVLGGTCYIAATIERPGVIRQTGSLQRLVFGELDGHRSPRAEAFLEACVKGAINAELSPNILRETWQKYAFLVALSGTTSTIRTPIGAIRSNPQTRAFLRDVMNEVVMVARASGIDLPADFADQRMNFADQVSPDMTSSMHRDLENGRPLEVRWLAGGVVALGRKAGVATPLNRAIFDILALHAEGRAAV